MARSFCSHVKSGANTDMTEPKGPTVLAVLVEEPELSGLVPELSG